MKVHLVDGTYELFRAWFGAPAATSPGGEEVGATRGLMMSLLSLLRPADVTHVAVAFDHEIESFRNDLFEGYKTGEGIDADLLAQFPLAERAAHALGIHVWPMVEFEADDALASGAARWAEEPAVEQVVLCTPDKDLAQSVRGRRVVMLDRRRRTVLDEDGVVAKFGVSPSSIPDWLALVGDAADGIPGIRGWGAKTSAALLAEYRHLEKIPADPARWAVPVRGAARLAASLEAGREDAALYKTLATLRTDAPVPGALSDLQWSGAREEELGALAAELGDPSFPDRVPRYR